MPRAYQGLELSRKIPFVCLANRCPRSCCGPFEGLSALQPALALFDLGLPLEGTEESSKRKDISLFAQIRLTTKDVKRLQDGGADHLIIRRGKPWTPHYYLRLKPDGACAAFASDKTCSIHSIRPTICRAFPFYIDMFAGLSLIKACSGINAGETAVSELEEEICASVEMAQFWTSEIAGCHCER